MAVDRKEIEAKYSTDTFVVILIIIIGLISVLVGGYFWFNPKENKVSQISITTLPLNTPLEDPAISIENSYLKEELIIPEEKKEDKILDTPVPKPQEIAPRPVITSIQNKTTTTTTTPEVKKVVPVVKKVEAPKQKLITVKGYWIQVGSFSTNAAAQKTVGDLKNVGLSSRVVISDINGKTQYRVRIGVYENKEEAYKFLEEVQKIKGYEKSYVSETTTQKYVNIN